MSKVPQPYRSDALVPRPAAPPPADAPPMVLTDDAGRLAGIRWHQTDEEAVAQRRREETRQRTREKLGCRFPNIRRNLVNLEHVLDGAIKARPGTGEYDAYADVLCAIQTGGHIAPEVYRAAVALLKLWEPRKQVITLAMGYACVATVPLSHVYDAVRGARMRYGRGDADDGTGGRWTRPLPWSVLVPLKRLRAWADLLPVPALRNVENLKVLPVVAGKFGEILADIEAPRRRLLEIQEALLSNATTAEIAACLERAAELLTTERAAIDALALGAKPKVVMNNPATLGLIRIITDELARNINAALPVADARPRHGALRVEVLDRTAAIVSAVYRIPMTAAEVKKAVAKTRAVAR